ANEDAEEILEAHVLEPANRAHRHVVAFAAQDAPGHQDHFGLRLDPPSLAHGVDADARHARRIEAREVDARGHHRDALPGRAVTVVDEWRDLLARRHHAVAARHHAVVEVLEPILLAEAFVPTGDEGDVAPACRPRRAPGGGAAEGVDDVAFGVTREPGEGY